MDTDPSIPRSPETYRRISELIRALGSGGGPEAMLRGLIEQLRAWSGCDAVGIRLRDGHDYPYFETRGFPGEFVRLESRLCATDGAGRPILDESGAPKLECMCGNVIQGRFNPDLPFFTAQGSFWTNSTTALLAGTTEADRQSSTRNRCNRAGYESVALVPLRFGDRTFGLLQFNDRREGRFTPDLIAFLECMADNVALALERLETEKALQESETRYQAMFQVNNAVKLLVDPTTGAILDANRAAVSFYGYSLEELTRMRISQINTLPEEEVREALSRAAGQAGRRFVFEHRLANGELRDVEIYSSPLPCRGKVLVYSIIHDITDRKKQEAERERTLAELGEQRAFLESLIRHSPIAVGVVSGPEHRFVLSNPAYEAALEGRGGPMTGRTVAELFPEVSRGVTELLDQVRGTGQPVHLREYEVPLGSRLSWWDAEYVPLPEEDGRIGKILILGHEVTQRKLAEDGLRRSLREKEVLLKEIHHRVKNNMQLISSLISLQAMEAASDPRVEAALDRMQFRIRSMALIHETLYKSSDFSRVDMVTYANKLCGSICAAYSSPNRPISLSFETREFFLAVDRALPCGLLINELVTNACKHASPPVGHPRVHILLKAEEDTVVLEVSDNGQGIPAPVLSQSRHGLGFQLIKSLSEQLRGELGFSCRQGTRARVVFPLRD